MCTVLCIVLCISVESTTRFLQWVALDRKNTEVMLNKLPDLVPMAASHFCGLGFLLSISAVADLTGFGLRQGVSVALKDAATSDSVRTRSIAERQRSEHSGSCTGSNLLCAEANRGPDDRTRKHLCAGLVHALGCEWRHSPRNTDAEQCRVRRRARRAELPWCDMSATAPSTATANLAAAAAADKAHDSNAQARTNPSGAAAYTTGKWVRSPAAALARQKGCSALDMAGYQCKQ